ncbi:MAG: ribonuclease HII [Chloroflexi bacterium RBG_13_51_36]|nr:MAG: ribonuclease HII [Chloroflexi bacterium RBG_13_51_36]
MRRFPNFDEENELKSQGYELIAGIDEVGRGALAGPVVAGAVILPNPANLSWLGLVRDSKELDSRKRESLFDLISREAVAVGIGIVPSQVIDSVNILRATRLAMVQAVEKLTKQPSFLLIDRVTLSQCPLPQRGITRGDKLCLSIACASIIAKVTRDHMMVEFDQIYPGYGFARHKGYGTGIHMSCLRKLGPSPIHRLYFAPVRAIIASQSSGHLASAHSEPFSFCHSDPLPFCHSEGVPMESGRPKNPTRRRLRGSTTSD